MGYRGEYVVEEIWCIIVTNSSIDVNYKTEKYSYKFSEGYTWEYTVNGIFNIDDDDKNRVLSTSIHRIRHIKFDQ